MRRWISWLALALLPVAHVSAAAPEGGVVEGVIRDAATDEPVPYVQILIEEANRSTSTNDTGLFRIQHVPAGRQTLRTFRIGYESITRTIDVPSSDTLRLSIVLRTSTLHFEELVVEGVSDEGSVDQGRAMVLEGRRLRQHLGATIAETIEDEPGLAMRSMGPAPARPVLRGLGGERLLVLEDGGRTGDLSETSADHALVVDPLTAERIEVIRGPASLAFGSNTLGGVVNVIRGFVPSTIPDAVRVTAALQGQTVNSGRASGIAASIPINGSLVIRGDASYRGAADVRTPVGRLGNTALRTVNGSIGASTVQRWGYMGVAGSRYSTRYGIPGGFVGAHPNGVDVHVTRDHLEGSGEWLTHAPALPRVTGRLTYSRYDHREFESSGNLGVAYGLVSYHGTLTAQTRALAGQAIGAVGLWGEYRDYAAGGFSFTPASVERSWAAYGYQDLHVGRLSLQAGLRYEHRRVEPRSKVSSGGDAPSVRSFGGLAASAALHWHPVDWMTVGVVGMRSRRTPGIEELYSEGPHLAAYSFEVGNANLSPEHGVGVELFSRFDARLVTGSAAVFLNRIDDFIFPMNTGEINHRVFLPIYRYEGERADFRGAEGRLEFRLGRGWSTEGTASYVRGHLSDLDQPVPWMPPFQGSVGLRYRWRALSLTASMRWAAAQKRTAPRETPTEGYALLDLFAQYHFSTGGTLHTFDLGFVNVTDATYRDHLSRVKSIMAEPARNLRLLYRIHL